MLDKGTVVANGLSNIEDFPTLHLSLFELIDSYTARTEEGLVKEVREKIEDAYKKTVMNGLSPFEISAQDYGNVLENVKMQVKHSCPKEDKRFIQKFVETEMFSKYIKEYKLKKDN